MTDQPLYSSVELPRFQWHWYDTCELHWHISCVGCKGPQPSHEEFEKLGEGERRTDYGCREPGCYGSGVRRIDVTHAYRTLLHNLGVVVALAAAAQVGLTT